MGIADKLHGWAGLKTESRKSEARIYEMYRELKQQIPLVYAIALVNVIGLHASTGGSLLSAKSPVNFLVVFVVYRLAFWSRKSSEPLTTAAMANELVRTWIFAIGVSVGFSVWAQLLISANLQTNNDITLFGILAAVGCAYGLSGFPLAAAVPLLTLGVPLAARLVSSSRPTDIGIGTSIALVIFIMLRVFSLKDKIIQDLIAERLSHDDERKRAEEAEEKATALSEIDFLTEIPNRRAFLSHLHTLDSVATPEEPFAVALVDLDQFKPINDTYGHLAGDDVLRAVARNLAQTFGKTALVARMGGDEFAICWSGPGAAERALLAASRVCATLSRVSLPYDQSIKISACCGVTVADHSRPNPTELLRRADIALYAAKSSGAGQYAIFSDNIMGQKIRRDNIQIKLNEALKDGNISCLFQPIFCLDSKATVSFEALARWTDERFGIVGPDEFISIAEETGQISNLTDHSLRIAATAGKEWRDDITLSFNISAVDLCSPGAAKRLLSILDGVEFSPKRIQFEVTETAKLTDFEEARRNLRLLRQSGSKIALDDFGAGHASISYLREMSFDAVKFDGTLIKDIAHSRHAQNLIGGLIGLCRSLGVTCVAEHVETEAQLSILRDLRCNYVQGFYVGLPSQSSSISKFYDGFATPSRSSRVA